MTADDTQPVFISREVMPTWVDAGAPLDDIGYTISDYGAIGIKLPGTSSMLICGPHFARQLAVLLIGGAGDADKVIAELLARFN